MTESPCGVIEWVGVALISKRASRGVILGVAGSRYTSGPYTPVDPTTIATDLEEVYTLQYLGVRQVGLSLWGRGRKYASTRDNAECIRSARL